MLVNLYMLIPFSVDISVQAERLAEVISAAPAADSSLSVESLKATVEENTCVLRQVLEVLRSLTLKP